MSASDASPLLRPGLLDGVALVLASASPPAPEVCSPGGAIAERCARLGARVLACPVGFDPQLEIDENALEHDAQAAGDRARARTSSLVMLAVDGASLFAHAGGRGAAASARRGLRACLAASWIVTRAVGARGLLAGGHGGRIVYLAPAGVGEHVDAARAGLENLARTLSIEWARHAITTVAIAPPGGAHGVAAGELAADQVANLVAYLASPAGAYFSGCLLDLRGPAGAPA